MESYNSNIFKTILATLFVSVFSFGNIYAQDSNRDMPDCLRNEYFFENGYRQLLIRTLMPMEDEDVKDGLEYGRICGTIFTLSFFPENCFYLSKDNDGYFIETCVADESIWHKTYNLRYKQKEEKYKGEDGKTFTAVSNIPLKFRWEDIKADVKVKRDRVRISKEQAKAIRRLYAAAVGSATSFFFPTEAYTIFTDENGNKKYSTTMGLDGSTTTYIYNGKMASCWSPPTGSKRERLNFLISRISEAIDEQDASLIDKEMDEINALTRGFREMLPDWAKNFFDNYEDL